MLFNRWGFAVPGGTYARRPPPAFLSARASIRVDPPLERVFGYADVNSPGGRVSGQTTGNITYVQPCVGASNQARYLST